MTRTPLHPAHLEFASRLDALVSGDLPKEALARDGGHVWSPYSAAEALTLVSAGARGRTRAELDGVLGGGAGGHAAALRAAAEDAPGLRAAVSLRVRSGARVLPGFAAALAARPGASVRTADFAGDPEGVRREANAEVSAATGGLLPELLGPESVRPGTRALLLSALLVRLRWKHPFDPALTAPLPFRTPGGERSVPMMHRTAGVPYAEAAGWRMASLFGRGGFFLDVLLPDDPAAAVPAGADLDALYRAAGWRLVSIALPRFEAAHRTDLAGPLRAAGVRALFSPAAELDGITGEPLLVDSVVHQARLRVDEDGAEGAAATAVPAAPGSAVRPLRFTADRPFCFVLRRGPAALFLGRVASPADPLAG
ncbi:serpin family protein [Nocardiopsis potens]|uniref:serpin family protein n=1 Tax=Nocardiopsis potens TaxID=1246458 RepID=UPI00034D50FA|nr:serpin family protein [Nocardiopsis potens]